MDLGITRLQSPRAGAVSLLRRASSLDHEWTKARVVAVGGAWAVARCDVVISLT